MIGLPRWYSNAYRQAYEGLNYRLRSLSGGRWADYCRPANIGVMMTNLCNARCVHCDIWKNKGREETPTVEQWQTVLSDLRSWLGPVHVFLSGGEALLRPATLDLLAHGSSVGLLMEVLTHGYWDDQSRIEKVALTNPWRVTVSCDGIGETHDKIRGRDHFFEKTNTTIETLKRVRKENNLKFKLRLKTVIMDQNLDDVAAVARFATNDGMEVFYQAIEQNYNTPEDPRWFEHSGNWPKDIPKAISAVRELVALTRQGLHIDNSYEQLEAMIDYFKAPDSLRVAIQSHIAHEHKAVCEALTGIQFQPNGDVLTCFNMEPVGNIRNTPIREIWNKRPHWWEGGCCLERRCTPAEKETLLLKEISSAR
jgi:MoaA/NifB/PqqE/SkfB family radical SAM enzyme